MAFNSAGEGPESERYLERTFRKAPQKPPASVNVWAHDPTTVRVVWRYVQPTNEEEPLLGYKVFSLPLRLLKTYNNTNNIMIIQSKASVLIKFIIRF